MTLTQLLGPLSVDEIRAALDRREPIRLHSGAHEVGQSLFNFEIAARIAEKQAESGVLRVLRKSALVPPEMLKTSRGSSRISGAALRRLVRQGVSLVSTGLEEFGPDLATLSMDAERRLACSLTLGMIATFGVGCALKPHWDPEDVLAIQMSGRKTWFLLGEPVDGLIGKEHRGEPPAGPVRRFVLEPGDVLAVPRGYWHRCESDGDNLQLSILIRRFTGADFIRDLARKVQDEPLFHKPIPLSRDSASCAELESAWKSRLGEILGGASVGRYLRAEDRAQEIPFSLDRTPVDPRAPGATLELVARRPLAMPDTPGDPIRMGGVTLIATPATVAVAEILNREISIATAALFERLAAGYSEDQIAAAVAGLDESCLARLRSLSDPAEEQGRD